MKAIAAKIDLLTLDSIEQLEHGQTLSIDNESISLSDVEIRRASKGDRPNLVAHQKVAIEVDSTLDEDQILEGLSREVMRKIQQSRKNADLKLDARISLSIHSEGKVKDAIQLHESVIRSETLCTDLNLCSDVDLVTGQYIETADFDEGSIKIGITVQAP